MQKKKPTKKKSFKPHIIHRKHTFKLMTRHHTSYSSLAFIVLLTAVFSIGWSAYVDGATSDSYEVRATIPADPLSEAATIVTPAPDQRFSNQTIEATGFCPNDSYVILSRNNSFAGTALCSENEWLLSLSLVPGANLLQVQAYNRTDAPGPESAGRTVYYDAPVTVIVPSSSDGGSISRKSPTDTPRNAPADVPPLVLGGAFSFIGVIAGEPYEQTFTIDGGRMPYDITIDWGDGSRDNLRLTQSGPFTVSHIYGEAERERQKSYIIMVHVSDVDTRQAQLQTFAIVTNEAGMLSGSSTGENDSAGGGIGATGRDPLESFWRVAGPLYAVTLISLTSFWLGQHKELEMLRHNTVKRRPHRHA